MAAMSLYIGGWQDDVPFQSPETQRSTSQPQSDALLSFDNIKTDEATIARKDVLFNILATQAHNFLSL